MAALECALPVTNVRAVAGMNQVTVSWDASANAEDAEVAYYYVQVLPEGRIVKVAADTLTAVVSGLKNGVAVEVIVHAASERGRSLPSKSVTVTPTNGMEGEVGGLIVKFEAGTDVTAGSSDMPGADRVDGIGLTADRELATDTHLVELSESVSLDEATRIATDLAADPKVKWAEPDQFVFVSSAQAPDDPQYATEQWNLWGEYGIGLGDGATRTTSAYDLNAGAGTTVAVIDTGITAHPDLDGQLVTGYDFVSDPDALAAPREEGGAPVRFDADGQSGWDADPTDPGDWRGVAPARNSTWHGTHIAGIIAAKANNAEGIAGIAPGAKVQPIRALSWRGGLMSDIAAAITWASGGTVDGVANNAKPADVINMSFTVNASCSVTLQTAINDANERGSVLVAAAGNANDDVANYAPANCSNVISVGATGRDGKRAPYSNWGAGVDISAPGGSVTNGGGIRSASNTGSRNAETPGYAAREGTSIAAAHVAAAVARMRSLNSTLSPSVVTRRVVGTDQVRAFASDQCDADTGKMCGAGIVSFAQAAATTTLTGTCATTSPGNVTSVSIAPGDTLEILKGNCVGAKVNFPEPSVMGVDAIGQSTVLNNATSPVGLYKNLATTTTFSTTMPGTYTIWLRINSSLQPAHTINITVEAAATPFTTTYAPAISGTAVVGQTLTATTADWDPVAAMTYQWFAGGSAISGATGATHVVQLAQVGKAITVKATGALSGYKTTTVESSATSVVPAVPFATTSAPTISGSVTVDSTLTASVSGWSPTPASIGYTWLADGQEIAGATSSTYVVKLADKDKQMSVRVKGSATGYLDAERTSAATSAVALPTGITVRYDANASGVAGSPPTDSGAYTMLQQATVKSHGTLSRDEFTFDSWNTRSDGTGTRYAAGALITIGSANVTLFAQWDAIYYTLSFEVGGVSTGETHQFVAGASVTLPAAPSSGPGFEAGKKFSGWYTDVALTQKAANAGEAFVPGSGSRTLYGKWLPYTVRFTGYSATSDSGTALPSGCSVPDTSLVWGQSIMLPALPADCARARLDGWYTVHSAPVDKHAGAAGNEYTPTGTPGDVTMYAKFQERYATWWISSGKPIAGPYAGLGETINLPTNPEYANKDFAYWRNNTRASSSLPERYWNNITQPFVQEMTWPQTMEAYCRYWLRFDFAGGASGPADIPHVASCLVDQHINIPEEVPMRAGYTFRDWFDGTFSWTKVADGFIGTSGTKWLTARWTANSNTAVFDSQGGSAVAGQTWLSDQGIAQPTAPQRAGFTFRGWAETANGNLVTFPFVPSTFGTVTMFAQWQANPVPEPASDPVPNPTTSDAPAVKPLDVPPPRVEVVAPEVVPARERPAVMVVDGRVEVLRVERNEVQVGLDVVGDDFTIALATADVAGNRITPAANASLVAPVLGQVQVQARGYVPDSMVSLYLIPRSSLQLRPRSQVSSYYLGEGRVRADQTLVDDFRLPDWAGAGEYVLQINGYTDTGSVRSINVQLDLIDVREMTTVAARVCVFPGSQVRLAAQCRQSLRSLVQLMPDEPTRVVLAITGVAYAQGDAERNERVAERRAKGIRQFLAKVGVSGKTTIDVVIEKGRVPGFFVDPPPPVAVSAKGKPASTVLLTVTWTQDGSGWAAS